MNKQAKIGIITHYYKSVNYGGNLQAYALCRFLNQNGFQAEQITFDRTTYNHVFKNLRSHAGRLYYAAKDIPNRIKYREIYRKIRVRNNAIAPFREVTVPHSDVVYSEKTIKRLACAYEVFITGSDQVWHPEAVCNAYLLDFKVPGLKKLSYAASVAKNELTASQQERYKNALYDYSAVSVREKDAVDLIQPLVPIPVHWVVDPVFLLNKMEWDELCVPDTINRPYVFCYFLGYNLTMRQLAKEYAEAKGLCLVTLPYLDGKYRSCDEDYGDAPLYDVSPERYLSLIKHANCIFTDSFHAMAFSLIMEKEYFVFERAQGSMTSRIKSLTSLFNTHNRYCNDQMTQNIECLNNVSSIKYQNGFPAFELIKKQSIDFLVNSIMS